MCISFPISTGKSKHTLSKGNGKRMFKHHSIRKFEKHLWKMCFSLWAETEITWKPPQAAALPHACLDDCTNLMPSETSSLIIKFLKIHNQSLFIFTFFILYTYILLLTFFILYTLGYLCNTSLTRHTGTAGALKILLSTYSMCKWCPKRSLDPSVLTSLMSKKIHPRSPPQTSAEALLVH